ncbi:hypothetical protein [Metarhizobium album]|uniref:hypothetical protein n=1 Tax=Metarhizobium album TaxID=2182425 RepID=UPI001403F7A4|nr:hypothetical protein [Rhizobium album]
MLQRLKGLAGDGAGVNIAHPATPDVTNLGRSTSRFHAQSKIIYTFKAYFRKE